MSAIDKARARHRIRQWSEGCFDIDHAGDVVVQIGDHQVSMTDLVSHARRNSARLPMLIRLPQLITARCDALCKAFDQQLGNNTGYTPVYPIKVNQREDVVQPLAAHPRCGLEAGSKPELIAAIAQADHNPVIVNGYKDQETIDLALTARAMGIDCCIVIEKPDELARVRNAVERLHIRPKLGIRLRLSSIASGKWQNSGGERAKFGLSSRQLFAMLTQLREQNCLDWIHMLHFHMGSQISTLNAIEKGLKEGLQFYAELKRAGAPLKTLDIGGGLAVDYTGGKSRDTFSMNYRLGDYAACVVDAVSRRCQQEDWALPHIITEAGRAMVAHHAILAFEITGVEDLTQTALPKSDPPIAEHCLVTNMQALAPQLVDQDIPELLEQAVAILEQGLQAFRHDELTLAQRARLEAAYFQLIRQAAPLLDSNRRSHQALMDQLRSQLAVKCFANFSMFQSLPDVWGIDQVFPILPLSGLHLPPNARAIIEDLTCDSDGRIAHFIDHDSTETTLPIHLPLHDNVFAAFLVGAYQETLGDIHNLFGDTDSISIIIDDGGMQCATSCAGDHTAQLLGYVGYDSDRIFAVLEQKVKNADLSDKAKSAFIESLRAGLHAYSYLHPDSA